MSVFDLPPRFPLRDHEGTLIAYHQRIELPSGGKTYPWFGPDGKTMGLAGRPTSSLPMYGSEEVALHPVGQPIIVVEGEKAMWGLSQLGQWPVLGTVTGASSHHSVAAVSPIAKDRIFILWPDNDEPGRKHMDRLAQTLLAAGAKKVSVIEVPGEWSKGHDAWDFIEPETYPEDFSKRRAWNDAVIEDVRSFVRDRAVAVVAEPVAEPQQLRMHIKTDSRQEGFMNAEDFALMLHGKRQPDGQWKAKCPAHEDRVASLSISEKNGRLVLNCFAGCEFIAILDAAGVR